MKWSNFAATLRRNPYLEIRVRSTVYTAGNVDRIENDQVAKEQAMSWVRHIAFRPLKSLDKKERGLDEMRVLPNGQTLFTWVEFNIYYTDEGDVGGDLQSGTLRSRDLLSGWAPGSIGYFLLARYWTVGRAIKHLERKQGKQGFRIVAVEFCNRVSFGNPEDTMQTHTVYAFDGLFRANEQSG